MNDVGMLTALLYRNNVKAVMEDVNSINLGAVYETFVAQELNAHGNGCFYYDNKKNGEVDYLIDDPVHCSTMPIEVKSGKDYRKHSALDRFLAVDDYHIHGAFVLSNERTVYSEGSITYMPIYNAMFFKPYGDVMDTWD